MRDAGEAVVPGSRQAQPATVLLPCLCTNMWMTCAQRCQTCVYTVEMLGIPLPDRNGNGTSTWARTNHMLCIQRKLGLSTCRTAKMMSEPNVYLSFIRL
jgi:hypothetical protein